MRPSDRSGKIEHVDSAAVYVRKAHELSEQEFAASVGSWFLVHVPTEMDATWDQDIQYETPYAELARPEEGHLRRATGLVRTWQVAPLRTQDGHAESGPLVVGRARHCDVVLRIPIVSKQHVQILGVGSSADSRVLSLLDLESANGTSLNGRALRPRESVEIRSGDRVGLGRFEVTVLHASEFREALIKAGREGRQLA